MGSINTYNLLKDELLTINSDMLKLLSKAKICMGMYDKSFEDWENTCSATAKQISEDIVRVAVVGPIKSGKSTFVNSLFKGDYLKRGAGVVTSIVTRIRSGKRLRAKLYFKSWDEVNSDINQALVLLPSMESRPETDRFDIRRKDDRGDLQKALESLSSDQLITNDTRNANSVLLLSYVKGYEEASRIISSDTTTHQYEGDTFAKHRDFTGDETMAVYLRDIQIEIDSATIGTNIEIADCQGSDSPNPLHLAMIQDYLMLTNLIVYVVSSRTGLRRADIRFLSMIKEMGIMDNILFVINCDFSEHDSINDLAVLIEKVRDEISLLKPDPEVYAFSGLYNLFKEKKNDLSAKDTSRLEQWKDQKDYTAFSDTSTERFESAFYKKLTDERFSLLIRNHLGRMNIVCSSFYQWTRINQDVFTRDAGSAEDLVKTIRKHQARMNQIKTMIRSTLDGALQKINRGLRSDVDHFFDDRNGDVLPVIIDFIKSYKVSYDKYEKNLISVGFPNTMYMVFQEFRQAIDRLMAETINPKVLGFVRNEERKIKKELELVSDPYNSMVKDALAEYEKTMEGFGIQHAGGITGNGETLDMESVKHIMGLHLPPTTAMMHYNTAIRTEAILRFGLYSTIKFIKKIFKKPIQNINEDALSALKHGVIRMKIETQKSIIAHFENYQENIKFQYILKLAEGVSNSLYKLLLERYLAYIADLSRTEELMKEKRTDKEQIIDGLKQMETDSREINNRIYGLGNKISALA